MMDNKLLAKSLQILKKYQDEGHVVFHSTDEIPRINLGCLLNAGFLKEVIRGWYIVDNPALDPGNTVSWYANFWKFISIYESYSNGNAWCLSPEQTIDLCSGNSVIPNQVTIYVTKGGNRLVPLLHNTSIFEIRKNKLPDDIVTVKETGVNLWPLESAIANVSASYWTKDKDAMIICLNSIKNLSPIINALIENKSKQKSGFIISALTETGRQDEAENMKRILKRFGVNPIISETETTNSAYTSERKLGKISIMWKKYREQIMNLDIPAPADNILITSIEEKYKDDAYHSLSIEGYRVSQELIDKVSRGKWDPKNNDEDMQMKNALVARGYFLAFCEVRNTIIDINKNHLNPGTAVKNAHMDWYTEMWKPFVLAGLYSSKDIIGYRNRPVYIKGSRHVPPSDIKVLDYMDELFYCLENEDNPIVRAVLGHFFLTWIHPFNDGNGRMARFLMNTMLTTGNYPWIIIPVTLRDNYMSALETASVDNDITGFANIVLELIKKG